MTVHFIGAGPGAAIADLTRPEPDRQLSCLVHAGSLIPEDILSHCPAVRASLIQPLWIWMPLLLNAKPPLKLARMLPGCIPVICRSGRQWENSLPAAG